jgi:formylglycine-generating enzyme required for sulfatase activity
MTRLAAAALLAVAPALGCATAPPAAPAGAASARAAGEARVDARGIEQVWVPAGSFLMGTDEATLGEIRGQNPPRWVARALASERPQHPVRLTRGFWIDRFEVTNVAFQTFADAGGYRERALWSEAGWTWLERQHLSNFPRDCGGGPRDPRVCVNWYEAEAYARWRGGRLPTEAEWEFAARGPDSRRYPWGDAFDAARCNVVNSEGTEPVGSHPTGASWVGAQDMAGNAMEWVQDWLDAGYYALAVRDDPPGPATGTVKVEKGGWWGSNPIVARSAYRHYEDPPEYNDKHIGFRIVIQE